MTTRIFVILDKSGSMEDCRADTIGGFNSFIRKQKKLNTDSAFLSLYQFDNEYEISYENTPIDQVPELTFETFEPSGQTALLDAIGKTINNIDQKNDDSIIVVIITDGEENSSREYKNKELINHMIKQKKELGWEFIFLGANQDAIQSANILGIGDSSALTYDVNASQSAFESLSGAISRSRSTPIKEAKKIHFTPEERTKSLDPSK